MPRKRNNRLVRPGSWVARTARAVKTFLWDVVIGLAVAGAIAEILAFLRWFFERRL